MTTIRGERVPLITWMEGPPITENIDVIDDRPPPLIMVFDDTSDVHEWLFAC
jgi:hypothetical protein